MISTIKGCKINQSYLVPEGLVCNDDVNHRKELCTDSGREAGTGLGPLLSEGPAQMHRTAGPPFTLPLTPPHVGHFQVPASKTETPAAPSPLTHTCWALLMLETRASLLPRPKLQWAGNDKPSVQYPKDVAGA